MKKKLIIVLFTIIAFICAVSYLKKDAIFQRGNPLPYLWTASQLSEENTICGTVR